MSKIITHSLTVVAMKNGIYSTSKTFVWDDLKAKPMAVAKKYFEGLCIGLGADKNSIDENWDSSSWSDMNGNEVLVIEGTTEVLTVGKPKKPKSYVYAVWTVDELPEDMDDFYIQCGAGETDWEPFSKDDKGAKLEIENLGNGFRVKFSAPSQGIEKRKAYWLSPALINDEHEASDWGIELNGNDVPTPDNQSNSEI